MSDLLKRLQRRVEVAKEVGHMFVSVHVDEELPALLSALENEADARRKVIEEAIAECESQQRGYHGRDHSSSAVRGAIGYCIDRIRALAKGE